MGKKLIILLFAMISASCYNKSSSSNSNQYLVSTFYPVYIMTENIVSGIEGVTVVNMVPPSGQHLHDYQLRPVDLKLIEKASILVVNGHGAEGFMDRIRKLYPSLPVIDSSNFLKFESNEHDHNEHDHNEHDHNEHDHNEHDHNEHFWMSIPLAIKQVNSIASQLSALDPSNEEAYINNSKRYSLELEELFMSMKIGLKPYEGRKVITFHEAFDYLVDDFGFDMIASFPHAEVDSTSTEIARLIDMIKKEDNVVLLGDIQYPEKLTQLIMSETGKKIYMIDSGVYGDGELDSYHKTMMNNMKILEEAFSN